MAERTYSSPLREAQAERTRERVVDAALRVLGSQSAAFTMPAVAKAARVSLPTVYRLFPNKTSLASAAADEVRSRFGIDPSDVADLDELLRRQRQHIDVAGASDDRLIRAQHRLSVEPMDPEDLSRRHRALAGVAEDVAGIDSEDRIRFTQILSIIFSSTTGMALWRFRLLNNDGADLIDWAVRTLIAGMQNKEGKQ